MTVRLIYGFDPLCGWCHAFAPTLRAVRAQLPDLPVTLRLGGLITGERIRPTADFRDEVLQSAVRMKAATGMVLGEGFLARILGDPTVISSSLPPSDALLQVRAAAPDRVLDMAIAMQEAYFGEGQDLNQSQTYADIAGRLNLAMTFDIPTPHTLKPALAREFDETRAIGVNSYPTFIIELGGGRKRIDISHDPEVMGSRIRAAMVVR